MLLAFFNYYFVQITLITSCFVFVSVLNFMTLQWVLQIHLLKESAIGHFGGSQKPGNKYRTWMLNAKNQALHFTHSWTKTTDCLLPSILVKNQRSPCHINTLFLNPSTSSGSMLDPGWSFLSSDLIANLNNNCIFFLIKECRV